MRSSLLATLLSAAVAAGSVVQRASSKLVLSHYMLGDITEDHAHKDIDDAIAMGIDGFVLNVGYPKQDWVSEVLSHLYGYADYLVKQGGNFKLAISLDLYATGAWCHDKKLGDTCGGPKEYDEILKGLLGRDSYLRYGPNNYPFITSFSTGGKEDTDFKKWKETFANKMYFVPGIDDTPGYWESHPAWWDYWGDLVDGVSSWESAWPEVHGTNEGDLTRDLAVMKPMQAKGKTYMIALSMLQYKNAYGANLYRRGEMNLIKRMQNILAMSPQPDFIQLLTWNDGPESHHFGNLWPEQNTDQQPNQYASPTGSDHSGLQPLFSAFIHAWKNGGAMVPSSLSKRSGALVPRADDIPQGALWHKTIFQKTDCPGADSDVKYFQAPNGSAAALDALHWALSVPSNAAGWTVDVVSNGKSISSTTLQAGINYGTVEDGVQEGTQRLVIQNGGKIVAGTDRGRCLSESCYDGIFNFNPQVMPVKADYDNRDCWQVGGKAVLDYEKKVVTGTTRGPMESGSSCQDTYGVVAQASMWDPLDCSKQFKEWFDDEYNQDYFSDTTLDQYNHWLPQFGWPMGKESSHERCQWEGTCAAIDCDDNASGSAWRFLVFNSAVHVWEYFDDIRHAIERAQADFSSTKVTLNKQFWNYVPNSVEGLTQMLNAISTVLGTLIAAASIFNSAYGVAGPIVSGLFNVGVLHLSPDDAEEIGSQIKVEEVVNKWLNMWVNVMEEASNALIDGDGKWRDADIQDIIKDGKWISSRKHSILGIPKGSTVELGRAVYQLLIGAIINISWKSQNVFIACAKMTKEEFDGKDVKAGSNDWRLKHWYDGYGCYYQAVKPKKYGAQWFPYQITPPGWGQLYEKDRSDGVDNYISFSTHDIIESSLDGYRLGGFNYTIDPVEVTEKIFAFDEDSSVRDVAKIPGFFQIPICMSALDDGLDAFWKALGEPYSHTQAAVMRDCWGNDDGFGLEIGDVMDSNWEWP